MDGATLLRKLREELGEQLGSAYLNDRTSYEHLWDAAIELNRKIRVLRSTQTITTVAETAAYTLNADFLELALRNDDGELIVKFSDGTNTYWPTICDYEDIIRDNNTTSQAIPDRFAIVDKSALYGQITGTTTSAGAASAGVSTLTDTSGLFTTTDYVSAGDIVHNTTNGYSGFVLSVTSATALSTAIFNDSNDASVGWGSAEAYVIQPQGRLQIQFDPPCSTADYTVTVYYIQRPDPVFHSYGTYRFQAQYLDSLVQWAAFRYKMRDREPAYGAGFKQDWAERVLRAGSQADRVLNRKGFKMRLIKSG